MSRLLCSRAPWTILPTHSRKPEHLVAVRKNAQLSWGQQHMVEPVGADEGLLPRGQQRVWTAAATPS